MAIVHEGSATTSATAGAGLTSINLPSGITAGELLVADFGINNPGTVTPPAGWTLRDSNTTRLARYYRVADGSEGATAAFTVNDRCGVVAHRFSGVDTSAPFDIATDSKANGLGTTATLTGVTTATDSAFLLGSIYIDDPGTADRNVGWTGLTEIVETASGRVISTAGATQATAGASGNKSGTWTTSDNWWGMLTALKPAAGGGTTEVTATRAISWDVRQQVSATRSASWDVRQAVAATRQALWNVRQRISSIRSATWDVRQRIIATRSASWDVRAIVTATRQLLWNVESLAATTQVTVERVLSWGVRQQVTATRAASWNVRARIVLSRVVRWDVRLRVATARSLSWRVRAAVNASRVLSWASRGRVAADRELVWNVESDLLPTYATTSATGHVTSDTTVTGGIAPLVEATSHTTAATSARGST